MPNRAAFPEPVRELLDDAYWRITVSPLKYERQRVSYENLRSVLDKAQVRLRGWYFPYLSNKPDEVVQGVNYYGTWCTFANYEYWRFYESAQLVHFHGVREQVEQGYKEQIDQISRRSLDWLKPDWATVRGFIDIINFLYTVSEVFVFAGRLASALEIDETMHIEIALKNINGFVLGVSDPSRAWHAFHQWKGGDDLAKTWDIEANELSIDPATSSLDAVEWFFHRFGWTDVNKQALRDAQSAFFKKQY
jgi:hypothetical protein